LTAITKVIFVQIIALATVQLSLLKVHRLSEFIQISTCIMLRYLLFGVIKFEVILSEITFELHVRLCMIMVDTLERSMISRLHHCFLVISQLDVRLKSHLSVLLLVLVGR